MNASVVEDGENVEQFNGREGETATLLSTLSVKPKVACCRFRPTSSQSFDGFSFPIAIRTESKFVLPLTKCALSYFQVGNSFNFA